MAVKLDKEKIQELLLAKGDKLALGLGLGAGGLLLVGGVLAAASNPFSTDPAKKLTTEAGRVTSAVAAAGESAADLPAWTGKKDIAGSPIDPALFAERGKIFEPVFRPNFLRENPAVRDALAFQLDVVRFPYKAYDIRDTDDGGKEIGVLVGKTIDKKDMLSYARAMQEAMSKVSQRPGSRPAQPPRPTPPATPPGVPGAPGGVPGAPGGMPGGAPGGMPGGPPSGRGGGMGGGEGGMGMAGGSRTDQTVEYVSPDRVAKEGLVVAESVAPLRAVMVHGLVPLREQLDEYQRALKVQPRYKDGKKTYEGVDPVQYAGFDVQRKITPPGGAPGDWTDYDHAPRYYEEVLARAVRNTAETSYLTRFFRYEDDLVHPLPEVADGLYEYPRLRMRQVDEAIDKMKAAGIQPQTASEIELRLSAAAKTKAGGSLLDPRRAMGGGGGGSGGSSFGFGASGPAGSPAGGSPGGGMSRGGGMGGQPPVNSGSSAGGSSEGGTMGGPGGVMGRGMGGPGGMMGGPGGMGMGLTASAQPDTDVLVLRFLDIDVQPGFTYQYRVRLKLKNPNYRRPVGGGNGVVSKQAAAVETIEGRWAAVPEQITLPAEKVLYAIDPQKYQDDFKAFYDLHNRELTLKKLAEIDQLDAGRRAVVQIHQWQPTVRIDGTTKREPIGTWIVADLPVAPGEFVGRRALVELPLWSAGLASYVLRELAGGVKVVGLRNQNFQPKGWPINFRTPDVLVDFDGGRQVQRVGDREVRDDAAQELLIVQPDGKLLVRNSAEDMKDKAREDRNKLWDDWLAKVRTRQSAPAAGPGGPLGAGGSPGGGFGRP